MHLTKSGALSFHPELWPALATWKRLALAGQWAGSPEGEVAMAAAVCQSLPIRHAVKGDQ